MAPNTARACKFCDVVAGRSDVPVVRSWPAALAITPRGAVAAGHLMVIPRMHVAAIWDLPPDTADALFAAVVELSGIMRTALAIQGLHTIVATGAPAGQRTPHIHVHLVPRHDGDAMGSIWPTGVTVSDTTSAAAIDAIRSAPVG